MTSADEPFGDALRRCRRHRGLSQLALALDAGISPRHLSCLETGRARPSRAMVARLGLALGLPLRQRNALLLAASFAPAYRDDGLDAPLLTPVREALELLLSSLDPHPAYVLDRRWDIVLGNRAHRRFLRAFGEARGRPFAARENALRLVFDPASLRPAIRNWPRVARVVLARLERDCRASFGDPALLALRAEMASYPGVAELLAEPLPADDPGLLVVPLELAFGDQVLSWFTSLARFGAAREIAAEEAVVELFLPADAGTRAFVERFAAAAL